MPSTLLDSLSGLMTPDVIGRTAATLGESPAGISKAATATFPSLLAGLVGKSTSPGAMDQLFQLIACPSNDGSALNNIGGLLPNAALRAAPPTSDLGGKFLSQVFNGHLGSVSGALGQFAGIKSSSATALLGMAAPLVLGTLGKTVRRDGLSASELTEFITSQKYSILGALPAGLAGPIGLGDMMRGVHSKLTPVETRRPGWLLPAAFALLALLAWLFVRPS